MAWRVKHSLFILIACASLVVSAFGACLCSHHEAEAEKPKLSCHSKSHEKESAKADPANSKFDELCICSADASPAIFNKSERKKSETLKEVAAAADLKVFETLSFPVITKTVSYPGRESFESGLHRISAPSRAPPRL